MYKYKSGKSIDLSKSKEIAAGGEGKILEHPTDRTKVVKIYHTPRKKDFDKHLEALSLLSDHFIKPDDVLYTDKNQVAGFIMDYVNFNDYWLFNNLFNKGFCNSNNIDNHFKILVLEQMKLCVEEVHSHNIVIGDLNQYNIFVSKKGKVLFVDVDSYGSKSQPHSGVIIEDIRDWTTLNINRETDSWSYDILAFWSTTFMHPFKFISKTNKQTLEQRVKDGKSILSNIPETIIPPIFQAPTGDTLRQFKEIFSGRRYLISLSGIPVPVTPIVFKQNLQSSKLDIFEIASNVTHVNTVNNYFTYRTADSDWHYVESNILKRVRELIIYHDRDYLYPSDIKDNIASVKGDSLIDRKNTTVFGKPEFYFNDGYLSVLSYDENIQTNYNLNNQLSGIDNLKTAVFARSVIYRDAPIQNFGAKKYLNVPIKNNYNLIPIHFGTMNAYYSRGIYGLEYKESNKSVKFSISDGKHEAQLDYFPYFAVKDKIVFVPDDNHIKVYKDFLPIAEMEAPCSKSSKLYSVASGILLLENNTLYLLNTK